jgi:predicted metallo-beta-lactamase superfamily hydrolase
VFDRIRATAKGREEFISNRSHLANQLNLVRGKEMDYMSDFSNAVWHKSTKSSTGACVEVATLDRAVGVRDSKDRQGPVLVFGFDEWSAFLAGVRDGEFDLP